MSIEPWLQEKSLAALKDAAKLIDLANDPETADWYAKALRRRGQSLVASLLPLVTTLFEADDAAMTPKQVSGISEGGSFALAKWCKQNRVGDPRDIADNLIRYRQGEREARSESDDQESPRAEDSLGVSAPGKRAARRMLIRSDDKRGLPLKTAVFGGMAYRMLRDTWPPTAVELMLWLLSRLEQSEFADVVTVSPKFLPGDIGTSPEAITEAYDWLYERGCIERIQDADVTDQNQLALRLVVEGVNESREPAPHRPETFGFPGYMINGRRAEWCFIDVPVTSSAAEALAGWRDRSASLDELQGALQRAFGDEQVVCELRLVGARGARQVHVKLRALPDRDEELLVRRATEITERWLQERYSGG